MELTPEQQESIIRNNIGNVATVGIPAKRKPLMADAYIFYHKYAWRYTSFSDLIMDAISCLLHYGPNWQDNGKDDKKLDSILAAIRDLSIMATAEPEKFQEQVKEIISQFDDSDGFVE